MVLCIEPQKIYSPEGCHELAFQGIFRTTAHGLKLQVEIDNDFRVGRGGGELARKETSNRSNEVGMFVLTFLLIVLYYLHFR